MTSDDDDDVRPSGRRFTLPGYEIGDPIGRGAFGVVYRAHERAFDRTVAIKVLNLALDESTQGRFDRECRSVGAVSGHPNIVTVYASGQDEMERPYLVMEFMEGGSFGERLDRDGPLTWQEVVDVGIKLAGALETAHRAGILHRDVKPENILISAYGEPKLGDFGISSIRGSYLTQSGIITATPLYAAPEVLNGQRASVASDVYSLAATLFCLLTGAPAFFRDDDESTFALFYRVSTDPVPDLRAHGVPDEVSRVIEAAMTKDPAERLSGAAALGGALREAQQALELPTTEMRIIIDRKAPVLREPPTVRPPAAVRTPESTRAPVAATPVPAPAPGPRGRRRPPIPVVALVSVVALVVAAVAFWPRGQSGDRASEDVRTGTSITVPPAMLALDRVAGPHGLTIDRTWTLDGARGEMFSSRVWVTNPTSEALTYRHDEVVPKSLADSDAKITFVPTPAVIVEHDPVVRFAVTLTPGGIFDLTYRVAVPGEGGDVVRLQRWAVNRLAAEATHRASAHALTDEQAVTVGIDPSGTVAVPDPANPGGVLVVPPAQSDSQGQSGNQPEPQGQDTVPPAATEQTQPPPTQATVPPTAQPPPPTTAKKQVLMPNLFNMGTSAASATIDALYAEGVDLGEAGNWNGFGGDPRRGIGYQVAYTPSVGFPQYHVWSQYPAPGAVLYDGMIVTFVQWDQEECDTNTGDYGLAGNWCYEDPPTQGVMPSYFDRHG